MPNLTFSVGEVATLLGITPKTVKHYHKIGLLTQAERDTNNYRLYDMAQILQLQQILQLRQFGLSLKQIETIIKSENSDELAKIVLRQHAINMRNEMSQLQHKLDITQDFLNAEGSLSQSRQPDRPRVSSLTTLSDTIKLHNSSVSDILVEVERDVMYKLDQFDWDSNYALFWHHAGKQFIARLKDERLFIFWMERYLALATMDADDLQGNAWLQELYQSPARQILIQALMPPTLSELPEKDQQQILKLVPSLMYQEGSSLQKHFLKLLINR